MRYDVCSKCGRRLYEGDLKYIVSMHIVADHDGVIDKDISDDEMQRLIAELEISDKDLIERDVHQELAFILCKRCKDVFVRDPFVTKKSSIDKGGGWKGELH